MIEGAAAGARVSVENVTKAFRSDNQHVVALEDFSLEAEPGSFVAIVGPSGCGKSTLLRMLAGLAEVTSGRILVDGKPVTGTMHDVGMVFQEDVLFKWRTVIKNVMLPVEIKRLDRRSHLKEAHRLLEQVGLKGFENALPSQLSGGMKQRVAICQALLQEPRLLLMDEPFGALDALTREQMQLDLQDLWLSHRNTVVFITHSISEAALLADRIIVMTPRPGRWAAEFQVSLPRPRSMEDRRSDEYRDITSEIHQIFQATGVLRA